MLGQRGQDDMIQAPKQLAFTDFYMPATAELTKEVFAQEASGAITQGLTQEGGYTAFGEQQNMWPKPLQLNSMQGCAGSCCTLFSAPALSAALQGCGKHNSHALLLLSIYASGCHDPLMSKRRAEPHISVSLPPPVSQPPPLAHSCTHLQPPC